MQQGCGEGSSPETRKDMKKLHIAASVAALGIMGAAVAQTDNYTPSDFTLRGGIVFPINNGLRDSSNLFGGVGLDYCFPRQAVRLGQDSETYFSGDWFFRGTSGGKGNVFPLAINQRWYSKVQGTKLDRYGRTYFSLGIGAAIIDVSHASGTEILGRGAIGVEFGQHMIAEAVLTISGQTRQDVSANAVGIYLGYRF